MLTGLVLASLAGLVTIWLLYPLVVGLLARVWSRADARPEAGAAPAWPLVSVVVATRDDLETVHARVADCLAADYPADRLEVIVALDRHGDVASAAAALAFPGRTVRVVEGDAPGGKASALNAGVRAARGEILVFADARQRFEPTAISRLVRALDDPRFGAVSGRLELRRSGRVSPVELYWRLERWLRLQEARIHSSVGVSGSIYASRRSLWLPLPAGLILDDVYAPMQIVLRGHRVGFVDDARAYETRHAEPQTEYRRKVRTLTGVFQLCAWLPAVLVPWRNPVWVQFLCHKLLRFLTPYWAAAVAVGVAVVGARWVMAHPLAAAVALAAVATASWIRGTSLLRVVRDSLAWAVALQASMIVAAVNGLRGRWDVWAK
jgi:cellulose synthase/poly-beta-1,6-N-acetylglucosamine synthase-like glycosyltransferase